MIKIGDRLINPEFVVSAEVEQRFYMNGASSHLVVKLSNGETIRMEHGYGFDAYAALRALGKSQPPGEG